MLRAVAAMPYERLPGGDMDRDKQLSLNFEPPPEPPAPAVRRLVSNSTQTLASAEVVLLPTGAERARKKALERERELLKRVLRRSLHF